MAWFTFHKGDRLVEWLHPFFLPTSAVLVGFLSKEVIGQFSKTLKVLSIMALVIIVGYSSVLFFNVKNAGQNLSGVIKLADKAEEFWYQHQEQPLELVGGSDYSEWLTFYIAPHPKVTKKWSSETLPNVYNRSITSDAIAEHGVLLIGQLGKGCESGTFSRFTEEWPQFAPNYTKEIGFRKSPQDDELRVCLGVVSPQ